MAKMTTVAIGTLALLLGTTLLPSAVAADATLWTSGGSPKSWTYTDDLVLGVSGKYETAAGGANYSNRECSFIESPAIPLLASTTLEFTHKWNIESFWDAGVVMLQLNGGAWKYLALPSYTNFALSSLPTSCLNGMGGTGPYKGYGGINAGTTTSVNLGSFGAVQGDSAKVRFVLATDSSVVRDGWEISAVSLGAVPILP